MKLRRVFGLLLWSVVLLVSLLILWLRLDSPMPTTELAIRRMERRNLMELSQKFALGPIQVHPSGTKFQDAVGVGEQYVVLGSAAQERTGWTGSVSRILDRSVPGAAEAWRTEENVSSVVLTGLPAGTAKAEVCLAQEDGAWSGTGTRLLADGVMVVECEEERSAGPAAGRAVLRAWDGQGTLLLETETDNRGIAVYVSDLYGGNPMTA